MGVLEDGQDKREWSCNSILCCIDYCKFIGLNKNHRMYGFVSSMTNRLNKCKCECLYMRVNVCLWVYSYVRVRKMIVIINVSVNVSDGVCNKLDNRDGYKC